MLNPTINLVIYEYVKELMYEGEEFSTCNVIDAIPANHYFQDEGTEYDTKRLGKIVNDVVETMLDEFDYIRSENDSKKSTSECLHWLPNYEDADVDDWDEDETEENSDWEKVERIPDGLGRITLPKKFLKQIGWSEGENLYVGLYGSEVAIAKDQETVKDAEDSYEISQNSQGTFQFTFNKKFDEYPDISFRTLEIYCDEENEMLHIFVKE